MFTVWISIKININSVTESIWTSASVFFLWLAINWKSKCHLLETLRKLDKTLSFNPHMLLFDITKPDIKWKWVCLRFDEIID